MPYRALQKDVRVLCVWYCLLGIVVGVAPPAVMPPSARPAVVANMQGTEIRSVATPGATATSDRQSASHLRGRSPTTPMQTKWANTEGTWMELSSSTSPTNVRIPVTKLINEPQGTYDPKWLNLLGALALVGVACAVVKGLWWRQRPKAVKDFATVSEMAATSNKVMSEQPKLAVAALASKAPLAGISQDCPIGHHRQNRVACGANKKRHNVWLFADGEDEGPPTVPRYLQPDAEKPEWVPDWLTLELWNTLPARDRARRVRWFKMWFDNNGKPCYDPKKFHTIPEALDILTGMFERSEHKFDPTVEVNLQMNLDPRQPDQQLRTDVKLPHGTGASKKVAVFCPEAEVAEVLELGAHMAGDELRQQIENEQFDFDILIAKPAMMPQLARLGKILGPRKMMPSPKSGTVVTDYEEAINKFASGGNIEIRMDMESHIQTVAGKLSMGNNKITENLQSLFEDLATKRPRGATNPYWGQVSISLWQCPSVKIDIERFPKVIEEEDEED